MSEEKIHPGMTNEEVSQVIFRSILAAVPKLIDEMHASGFSKSDLERLTPKIYQKLREAYHLAYEISLINLGRGVPGSASKH